jgi:hypothetical protein
MVPAPRVGEPEELPDDLARLRQMYVHLPSAPTRYRTQAGRDYLDFLAVCIQRGHSGPTVAAALGVTRQGVRFMLKVRRVRHPVPTPSDDDMRELYPAWRIAKALSHVCRRQDPEYVGVHLALKNLLERFSLYDIAPKLKVTPRELGRFVNDPVTSTADTQELARAVRKQVNHGPRQGV